MRNVRVLLVDDDEEDFLLTRDYLDEVDGRPYVLDWANSAASATQLVLGETPPDVCLIDYRLGPDDGIALTEELIAGGYAGPVIMLTGQRDTTLDDRALAGGAVDYLVKSAVTADQLDRAIRYALTRKQFEHEKLERIRAETRHRRADAENRMKSEFIAYISHELRTPLAAILGYADLVALRASADSVVEYAEAISRNGQYLNGLLNDILDLSKIEAGKLDLEIERVRTEHLIADVTSMVRIDVEKSGLSLQIELPDALPEYLLTDARRLRQMLLNLIGNAIKYTNEGCITFRVLFDSAGSRQIVFEVEDTGIGIDADQMQLIFEPFVQINELRGASDGLGLGLSICRRLAERLRGDITAESEPGQGSVFRLSIDPNCDAQLRRLDPANIDTTPHWAGADFEISGHVVIVDDSPDVRTTTAQVLETLGASVATHESGFELLENAKGTARIDDFADIVLLDMQMPGMSGYEAVRRLRSLGYSKPVIAVTAAAMKGAKERCLTAGCDDYLTKPVAAATLVQHISRWLARNGPGRPATKVLLVDDATGAVEAVAALLNAGGAEVVTAASAAQCFDAVGRFTPDIALLDYRLPDSRGSDLCRSLRALEGFDEAKIVVMTGMSRSELDQDELDCFDAFLPKPASLRDLRDLFARLGFRLVNDAYDA